MKIAIIVLNWNGEKYIDKCLKSLEKLRTNSYLVEVVVVDGGSTDNSVVFIKNNFPQFTLIQKSENLGYAAGNNVGLQYALDNNYDYAWIVNPDIEVNLNALLPLVTLCESDSKIGACGSEVYFAPGFEFHKGRYKKADLGKVIWFAGGQLDWNNVQSVHRGLDEVDTGQYDQMDEVGFLTGSSMLLRCSVLKEVGLLDPKYFLYYEENDLCQRILRAGYKLGYVSKSKVWHANAQATGAGSDLVDYYTTRNQLLFGLRWAPLKTKLALIRQSFRFLISGRPWQKQGVIDFYLGKMGKGSYVK